MGAGAASRLTSPLEGADDRRLVAGVRTGDEAAFEALVGRYRRELVAHARRVVAYDDAEDVVQIACLRAYRALRHSGAEPVLLGPWLHRIVHNAGLDVLRRRVAPAAWDVEAEPSGADPHEALTQRERIRELTAAIRALPDGEREALVGHEFEGRSHEELGRAAGRNSVAVRQAARRARARLRRAVFGWAPAGWLVRLLDWPGRAAESAVPAAPAARAAGCLALVAAGAVAVGGGHVATRWPRHHAHASPPARTVPATARGPAAGRAVATPSRRRAAATAPTIPSTRGRHVEVHRARDEGHRSGREGSREDAAPVGRGRRGSSSRSAASGGGADGGPGPRPVASPTSTASGSGRGPSGESETSRSSESSSGSASSSSGGSGGGASVASGGSGPGASDASGGSGGGASGVSGGSGGGGSGGGGDSAGGGSGPS
jgi:RNA polymerase sigma factor (sigma-70 family)